MITAKSDNEEIVINALEGLYFGSEKQKKFSKRVGNAMVTSTQERIDDEVSPDGMPWLPSIRAKSEGGQTLRDTGRLYNSLTFLLVEDGVAWGTNVEYAPYLHYGATITPKNADYLAFMTALGFVMTKEVTLPARPFLGISDDNVIEINNILYGLYDE